MKYPKLDFSDVSIVVLSHNRKDDFRDNLRELMALADESGCELIVVDNASTDGSGEMIADAIVGRRNVKFVRNDANLGVAGGRNAGWCEATRTFLLNIDDDTLVSAKAIEVMRSLMQARPDLGIVSPRIFHASTGSSQFEFGDKAYRPANFHGACHIIRRAVLDAAGLNDDVCTFGGEELDLSIRVRAAGFEIEYLPYATVRHNNFVRKDEEDGARRQKRVYNSTRVHHIHFSLGVALPLTGRYLVSHIVSGMRVYGPRFAIPLIGAAIRGFRDGRRQHRPVPKHVVRFYRNPDLRPDFGNVPLSQKIKRKWARRNG